MLTRLKHLVNILLICGSSVAFAQSARLIPTDEHLFFPTMADGNSSLFWLNGRLNLFTSVGWPQYISTADNIFSPWETQEVDTSEMVGKTTWMEASWVDDDGAVFCWYHHEPGGVIAGTKITSPVICAAISFDGGKTVHELGTILESGEPIDTETQNGWFAGGHGDFSVVLDHERKYFYFFFTNYSGPIETQGIVVARMAFEDRFNPAGKVQKYYNGEWNEPGLGGTMTPIFQTVRTWQAEDPDSYWGPAVHWNTYLNRWVMMLNRNLGVPCFYEEGVYVSFCEDITRPDSWKTPQKILDGSELANRAVYYPMVVGLDEGDTDTRAGRVARFFMFGTSYWLIEFSLDDPTEELPPETPSETEDPTNDDGTDSGEMPPWDGDLNPPGDPTVSGDTFSGPTPALSTKTPSQRIDALGDMIDQLLLPQLD